MSRASRGAALVLSLVVVSALAILTVAAYRLTRQLVKESLYQKRRAQASELAASALELGLLQLAQDSTWRGSASGLSFGGGTVGYSVTGTPPVVVGMGSSAAAPILGSAFATYRAEGAVTGGETTGGYGAVVAELADVSGLADIYYSTVSFTPAAFLHGAHVWSNGDLTTLNGAVRIRGDAVRLTGAAPQAATVAGTISVSTWTRTLPFTAAGVYATTNDNATITPASVYSAATRRLTVGSGVTATMYPGNYYLDRIRITGTLNVLTATGTVSIYLTGDFNDQAGNTGPVVNSSSSPARFNIYSQGNNAVNIRSASPLHANIENQPGITTVRTTLYGAVTGRRLLVISGATFHVDGSLPLPGSYVTPITRVSWSTGTWTQLLTRQ